MDPKLTAFREQLVQAASAFATDEHPLSKLLQEMVGDMERAMHEPLELFPVCHHSPASGLHLLQRLQRRKYKVLFLEMCEDLRVTLDNLRSCRFPVALQAFSAGSPAFPEEWAPLNLVAPLTEFSAEYQAIAYAMEHPETELVFVDRAVDYVYQWMPKEKDALEKAAAHSEEPDDADANTPEEANKPRVTHGSALGLQLGNLVPTFGEFLDFLLRNAKVKHFAEWWDQYVEGAVVGADYETYRQVLFLVGSLMRRLGRKEEDKTTDRLREKYMWTRMKTYLKEHNIAPEDALHICGAAHTASDVEEFGVKSAALWEPPARTETKYLYGVIPSSFLAIEHQFGHPSGTLRLAESEWNKALQAFGVAPLKIGKKEKVVAPSDETPKSKAKGKAKKGKAAEETAAPEAPATAMSDALAKEGQKGELLSFFTRPPELRVGDEEELLRWCVDITAMARENGYLTSTADSIAIYQTAKLLAGLRNRKHPSPYDFTDAAVTCLEKDRTPKRRDIRRCCEILLGGDRIGLVGYASLPPLAQNVYDRLRPLEGPKFKLEGTNIQRALMDLKGHPELLPCSDLLWILHRLDPGICKPIMGERALGTKAVQESWDVYIGRNQGALIRLGYEGVSVEHVFERRVKTRAFAPSATTSQALAAVEDTVLFLKSPRLLTELGERAIELLSASTSGSDAPEVFERVRRLVHYFRATPTGIPEWLKRLVTTGYSHYATLLPTAFQDDSTSPQQIAAMLAFLFTLESLALSFGCQRSQLVISIRQAALGTEQPTKLGLLWSAEWLVGIRDVKELRAFLDAVLNNVMMLPVFPEYVTGFLLALGFTPLVGRLVVELLSKSFAVLPDEVLMPWLPSLLMALRPHAGELVPLLLKEAGNVFPRSLAALAGWTPPWEESDEETAPDEQESGEQPSAAPSVSSALSPNETAIRALLDAQRVPLDALAAHVGAQGTWVALTAPSAAEQATAEAPKPAAKVSSSKSAATASGPVMELLKAYPAALEALSK